MIVALPTHTGDISELYRLLQWMEKLGGCGAHKAIIIADAATPFNIVAEASKLARKIFSDARVISTGASTSGWPQGANSLFRAAKVIDEPFLWMEPDAVPLRPGWLDEIERAYIASGKKFMGHIYDCRQPLMPLRLMSGIAVYPAHGGLPDLPDSPRAWDVDCAEIMIADGAHTPLIHHIWGQKDLPPVFTHRRTPQSLIQFKTLEDIPSEAAVFHRNKDGSLIRLLERKFFPRQGQQMAVCFNVHAGDVNLAVIHSAWLRKMNRRHNNVAVICHDPSCPITALNQLEQNLRASFAEVQTFVYQRPPIPTYPASANWAFQSTAFHMQSLARPWLWFEADAIALKPDWIDQLQNEYDSAGASFMGPVVAHMNHLQGTSIYPADAAARMVRAMSCGANEAFDMAAHQDTLNDRHDASHLMFHLWTLVGRMAHPVGGGEIPAGITADEISRWLPKSAVFLHRIKDDSVLRLLINGAFRP